MPERVQLRRTKGWRMPPNTVKVARPGPWGNRFAVRRVESSACGTAWAVVDTGDGEEFEMERFDTKAKASECAVYLHRQCLEPDDVARARAELGDQNLACWCPLDQPCHADILLEIANS